MNAACPAANEMAAGAMPANRMASGSSVQRTPDEVPITCSSRAPTTKPAMVPARPRRTFWPVFRAFERSTDSVPRMTQNECWTPV